MAFVGPNTQFKNTSSKFRRILRGLGFNFIEVYNRMRAYKLRKHVYDFTITALSTATTAGSQYTTPNAQIFTVQESAPVGATTIRMSCELGQPDAASSTLTYVASSSGTLGTHQASISYSAILSSTSADLGPLKLQQQDNACQLKVALRLNLCMQCKRTLNLLHSMELSLKLPKNLLKECLKNVGVS